MASPPGGYGPPGGGYPPPPPPRPPGYGPQGYQPQPGPAQKPITGSAQTMALHAMTIDPKTGLPRGEKPPASTAAVLALVCGILLCLGPLTGPVAIVAGFVARAQVKAKPTSVGGQGMATAGLVLGTISILGWLCALIYYLSQDT